MPIDKFGRHILHHKSTYPRLYVNCVLTLTLRRSNLPFSADGTKLGYSYKVHGASNLYSFPLSLGIVQELRIFPHSDITFYNHSSGKLFTADTIIGQKVTQGETLLFLSKDKDPGERVVELIFKCPVENE